MISVRIKIGDGNIVDTASAYGLVYLDSDKRVGPDIKKFEATTYPEENGEHILPKTVDAAFDYKVKFFIQATSLKDANKLISEFNSALFTPAVSGDVKTYKRVALFNDYKRHKIVGYPQPIAMAEDFWRDRSNQVNDVVIVEFTIRVDKPGDCEYSTPFSDDIPAQTPQSNDSETSGD